MRRVDLHAYPGTAEWIASQGPYAEALGQYWHKRWAPMAERDVVADFRTHGVEAVLVPFDIESVTGAPACTTEYVAGLRDRYPDTFIQAWGTVDPLQDEKAVADAERAVTDYRVLGFHFHPIMGRYSVDDPRFTPLFETINGLGVPVMIDVGTTGMGAGMPGGDGARNPPRPSPGDRRARRHLPRDDHCRRASGLALGGGDDRGRAAQGQRVLGAVGVGAQALPARPADRRARPPSGQDHVRDGLPEPAARPTAARVGRAGIQRGDHAQGVPRQRRADARIAGLGRGSQPVPAPVARERS